MIHFFIYTFYKTLTEKHAKFSRKPSPEHIALSLRTGEILENPVMCFAQAQRGLVANLDEFQTF